MDYISQTFKNRRRSAYLSADPDPEETAGRLMRLFDSAKEEDESDKKGKKPDSDKTSPIVTQLAGQPGQSLFDWERPARIIGLGTIGVLLVVGGLTLLNVGINKEGLT